MANLSNTPILFIARETVHSPNLSESESEQVHAEPAPKLPSSTAGSALSVTSRTKAREQVHGRLSNSSGSMMQVSGSAQSVSAAVSTAVSTRKSHRSSGKTSP
jgi:hypothetical protein